LTKIIESRKRTDAFSILAIQMLIELCVEDDMIARYVYDVMPPILAQAHFYDFFEDFIENVRSELGGHGNPVTGTHKTERQEALDVVEKLQVTFNNKMHQFMVEDRQKAEGKGGFENHEATWLAFKHPEVIEHFPPQFIIGK